MTIMQDIPSGLYTQFVTHKNFNNNVAYKAYGYYDENGDLIGAACRIDFINPDGKQDKVFFQRSYMKRGDKWSGNGNSIRGMLYNLPAVTNADKIVFVEGEKTAEALQLILPDGWAATTGIGGASNYNNINFTHLKGKDVIIWRDNDEPGQTGAMRANFKMIKDGVRPLGWVKIEDTWKPKWDAVDVIEQLGANAALDALKSLQNYNDKVEQSIPKIDLAEMLPFKILGQNANNEVFFYSYKTGMIMSCSERNFTEMKMVEIHNDISFWERFCGVKGEGNKINKTNGWSVIWKEVEKVGLYSEEKIRGFGMFKDKTPEGDDVYVANLGDMLYINGKTLAHADFCHNHVYVKDKFSDVDLDQEKMTDQESKNIVELYEMLQIKGKDKRQAFIGFLVSSMFSGALPNRPHAWMYANGNSGKSFIREWSLKLMKGFAVGVAGSTTPAGIRQEIGSASRLVGWEEAETTDDNVEKYRSVMEMARLSFDAQDDSIVMGTRDGKGKKYIPRMMYLFTSIRMISLDEANGSRMMTFDLLQFKDGDEQFKKLKDDCESKVMSINWDGVSSRLFKRCYDHADAFFHNLNVARIYLKTEAEMDTRRSSTMACMYAGWQLMLHTNKMTIEDVADTIWVDPKRMLPVEIAETKEFQEKMLGAMVTASDGATGRPKRVSLGEYIIACREKENFVRGCPVREVDEILQNFGVKYYENNKKPSLAVWTKSPHLQSILYGYRQGLREMASSLPDYEKDATLRFNGVNKRCFTFSLDTTDFE